MKLYRFFSALLAAVLVVGMIGCAGAAPALVDSYNIASRYPSVNIYSNTYACQNPDTGYYVLYTADGTALTTEAYINMDPLQSMYEVAVKSDDEVNLFGVMDSTGKLLVPMQYGDVECISDRWQMGVKLKEATSENYDYKSFGGDNFYLVDAYDFYYCGTLAGSLGRLDYTMAYAYGDYLYIRNEEGNYTYYDSTMTASAYASDFSSSQEFEEVKGAVWHRGSNQQAFTTGCTLTEDNVEQKYWVLGGRVVDLQGNELGVVDSKYESVYSFEGDYAKVRANGKYGLIDYTGREVMACEYDEISYGETYFEGGYQIAVKDGKVGFVNTDGEVTCEFKYASGSVDSTYKMPATTLTDLEGNVIILSGAGGEIAAGYQETYIGRNGCTLIAVSDGENAGVIDLYGNVVIPLDGKYDDVYDFTITADGSMVVANDVDRNTTVYCFAEAGNTAAESEEAKADSTAADAAKNAASAAKGDEAAEEEPAAEEPAAEETAEADAGWTCSCGSEGNTGKFCPECGGAAPAEKLVCGECGFEPADGETPKFCSECGSAF